MNTTKISWEDAVRWCMAEPSMSELARDAYFLPPVEAAQRYKNSAEFSEIRRLLPAKKGRVLDLGAGNGILSYALASDGWSVTAVEPDPSELIGAGAIRQMANETGTSIDVIEAFGEDIPIDIPFDLVVARQVLHHANDLDAFCHEMARLSRPGATILTLRDHVISGPEQMEKFLDNHPLHYLYGGENAFTLKQYQKALGNAGISIHKELRSFQSVINYDPQTKIELLERFGQMFGPAKAVIGPILSVLPFQFVASLATMLDRRPGRLVSYLGKREP